MKKQILTHEYDLEPIVEEDFANLDRWVALEQNGTWETKNGALEGEWRTARPSLFFKQKIVGDFVWEIDVTRLETDTQFLARYKATQWGTDPPSHQYNFNFWIRADAPDASGGTFFEQYPRYLKAGWNGMGDDRWHSYFNTIVWNPRENWARLRRSPGYELRQDVHDAVPFMKWGETHKFTFAVVGGRVRLYVDESIPVYDYQDQEPYGAGFIGLCVWLCKVRFERMRVWRIA